MTPRPSPGIFSLPPRFLCPGVSRTFLRTIRSIVKKKNVNQIINNRYNNLPGRDKLGATKMAAFERKRSVLPRRTGALAIKAGMTGMYDQENAKRSPCTVLYIDRNQVVSHKRLDVHGYWAVQVGAGTRKPANMTRAERGHFAGAGVALKSHLSEFRVRSEEGLVPVGTTLTADLFVEGQFVDVRAKAKGKGFAGGMKKHGWAGQPASHGNSLSHRAMGSAGASQGSGSRVHPGKKMAGRMGGEQRTVQNLKVVKVDKERGIVVVAGHVPGPRRTIVKLQDAIKKQWPDAPAFIPAGAVNAETTSVEATT